MLGDFYQLFIGAQYFSSLSLRISSIKYSRWKKMSVLMLLITLTVCSFCGKAFQSLGRHSWRCKSKIEGSLDANPINNGFNNIKHQLKHVEPENNAAIMLLWETM